MINLKRGMDLFISSGVLIVFSPVIGATAALIKVFIGSPVVFKQERPGKNLKPFFVYKFRTMKDLTNDQGEQLLDRDRLTKLGAILRKFSLDEFPQLWNVIKGDMSLVGPRPLLMRYTPYFREEEKKRFNVLPGITGWAQVHGRNTSTWDERFRLDVWYVDNNSFWLDVKILFLTALKVFKSDGVVVDARSIMKNFDEERRGTDDYL